MHRNPRNTHPAPQAAPSSRRSPCSPDRGTRTAAQRRLPRHPAHPPPRPWPIPWPRPWSCSSSSCRRRRGCDPSCSINQSKRFNHRDTESTEKGTERLRFESFCFPLCSLCLCGSILCSDVDGLARFGELALVDGGDDAELDHQFLEHLGQQRLRAVALRFGWVVVDLDDDP